MRHAATVAVAAFAAPAAALAGPPVLLPSPVRPPTATPPLATRALVTEVRWPGRLSSVERVLVGVDGTGRPVSVVVGQRLLVGGLGDYALVVPAPARDVRRAPGSAAEPGLRSNAVLWQGFSPGGEVLAASVDLRPAAAVASLPLRLDVTRHGGSSTVRIENATPTRVAVPTGVGRPRELAAILRALRGAPSGDVFAQISGQVRSRNVSIEAPLHVHGEIAGGARRIPVDVVLGGGGPLATTFAVQGKRAPRVQLTVEPFLPARLLRLPARVAGARALGLTVETLSRAARVAQYRTFLANPDRRGRSTAIYRYRTTAVRAVAAPPPHGDDDGLGALGLALWLAVAAAALVGGAVLWARS